MYVAREPLNVTGGRAALNSDLYGFHAALNTHSIWITLALALTLALSQTLTLTATLTLALATLALAGLRRRAHA
jgi:hypothetical protein